MFIKKIVSKLNEIVFILTGSLLSKNRANTNKNTIPKAPRLWLMTTAPKRKIESRVNKNTYFFKPHL
jgi:hypothetical protein